jgi:DNA-binding HxlR family transcriptional regulator
VSSEKEPTRRDCPIADAVGIVGDRYTFPLLREIAYGNRRFNDLAAYTGAPRNLLTSRLRMLEEAGVLERVPYSQRPPRYEYVLTAAGEELLPIMHHLKEWGERHCRDGEPVVTLTHTCGAEYHPLTVCAACREPFTPGSLQIVGGVPESVA